VNSRQSNGEAGVNFVGENWKSVRKESSELKETTHARCVLNEGATKEKDVERGEEAV